jgi:hypothetical protein
VCFALGRDGNPAKQQIFKKHGKHTMKTGQNQNSGRPRTAAEPPQRADDVSVTTSTWAGGGSVRAIYAIGVVILVAGVIVIGLALVASAWITPQEVTALLSNLPSVTLSPGE